MSAKFIKEVTSVLKNYGYKPEEVLPQIEKKLDEFGVLHKQRKVYHNGELTVRAESLFRDMRNLLFLEALLRIQQNEEVSDRIIFLNGVFRSRQNYKVIR